MKPTGVRTLVALATALLLSFASRVPAREAAVNLHWADDWLPPILADAVQNTSPIRVWTAVGDGTLTLDAEGWPTTDASLIIWHGLPNSRLGKYRLYFEGQANIGLGFTNGTMVVESNVYTAATHSSVVTLHLQAHASQFQLVFTGTNGGVRNVKVMRPVEDGSVISHDPEEVVDRVMAAQLTQLNTVRYMDPLRTNSEPELQWGDRQLPGQFINRRKFNAYPLPNGATRSTGMPWEYIIAIANATQTNAYICLPAFVDSDYIRKVAQLFRYGSDGVNPYTSEQANPLWAPLDPNLKLYVEYSNEVWNSGGSFNQFHYALDRAQQLVAENLDHPINFDRLAPDADAIFTNRYNFRARFTAWRGAEMSRVFREVFADQMMTRVRPLYGHQIKRGNAASDDIHGLGWTSAYYIHTEGRPVQYFFWGGGPATYRAAAANVTIDTLWSTGNFDRATYKADMAVNVRAMRAFGIEAVSYEGMPAFGDPLGGSGTHPLAQEAFYDPRMYDEMIESYELFEEVGGLFQTTYVWHHDYRWSHIDPVTYSTDTYRAQAVLEAKDAPSSPLDVGQAVPFTFPGRNYQISSPGWRINQSAATGTQTVDLITGYIGYAFRSQTSGAFDAQVTYSLPAAGKFVVQVNGEIAGIIDAPSATGTVTTSPHRFQLGTNTLGTVTVQKLSGANPTVHQVAITAAPSSGSAITLNNLNHTYDGSPKTPSVLTQPAGLPYTLTYNGSSTAPSQAGSYTVVATITDPAHASTTSGTLVIAKAAATVTLDNLEQPHDGSPKSVTVTTVPANLAVSVTYAGAPTPPTAPGSYEVVATVTDSNYAGSASGTLVITGGAAQARPFSYLRFEITSATGNGQLHFGEIEWLVGGTRHPLTALTSNTGGTVTVSSNYQYSTTAWRVFDHNNTSGQPTFFVDANNTTTPLPIHITAHFPSGPIAPTAVRISRPTWNDNMTGLRILGSNDGETWTLLVEDTNALAAFAPVSGVDQATYTIPPGIIDDEEPDPTEGPYADGYHYLRVWIEGSQSTSAAGAGTVQLRELRWLSGDRELPLSVVTNSTGNAEVTISSTTDNVGALDRMAFTLDNNYGSHWYVNMRDAAGTPNAVPREMTLYFPASPVYPTGIRLTTPSTSRPSAFRCEGSNDGITWVPLFSASGLTAADLAEPSPSSTVSGRFDFGVSVPPGLDETAPSVPNGLTVDEARDITADISWTASTDNSDDTLLYNLFVDGTLWLTTSETEVTLHGFSPETTYSVTLTARDARGNESQPSAPLLVTTTAGVPAVTSMQLGMGLHSDLTGMFRPGVDFAAEWANYAESNPFSATFLEELSAFKVLRFMDWVSTNNNWTTDWAERRLPSAAQSVNSNFTATTIRSANGVSWEWMIRLCNLQHADFWVTIPHAVPDDYVIQLATLIKQHLDPSLKVYVEYSNEVWNTGFAQATYASEQGQALGLHLNVANTYGQSAAALARARFYVLRSLQIHQLFDDVYGADSTRLVHTLAGQAANTNVSVLHRDALVDPVTNPTGRTIDAYSLAPYFSFSTDGGVPNLLEVMLNEIDTTVLSRSQAQYAIWAPLGIPLICYEGGQHITNNAEAASRNPVMYTAYKHYLDTIAPYYDVFVHYNYAQGWIPARAYGSKPSVGYPDLISYKHRAMEDWAALNPTTGGSALPTIVAHPQDASVGTGATVTFNAMAVGQPPLSYQWYRDGAPLTGETGSALTLTAVGPEWNGAEIWADITNATGTVTTERALLTVAEIAIPHTATSPALDGQLDPAWENAPSWALEHVALGTVSGPADLSAHYRALWNETGLFLFVQVDDDVLVGDASGSNPSAWLFDSVDFYLDPGNDKAASYQPGDAQYVFRWNGALQGGSGNPSLTGITAASQTNGTRYTVEIHFPWSALGASSGADDLIGLEVMINDNDAPGTAVREGKLAWWGTADQAWSSPALFGSGRLVAPLNNAPVIPTTSLTNGTVGQTYEETLTASGGDGALSWDVSTGALPPGLTLSPAGVLAGQPTAAGTFDFTVRVADSDDVTGETDEAEQPLSLTIAPGEATITLLDLAQTFNGSPRAVTATTVPAGLDVAITYDGSSVPPLDAGTYAVLAVIADPNYTGSASGILTVQAAVAEVVLGELVQTYDGQPKSVTVTTQPAGLTAAVTYDGSATLPVDAGTYSVSATLQERNYTGSATGVLTIQPAVAEIVLQGLRRWYDGSPNPVIAITDPADLPVSITYNGDSAPPTWPGVYDVEALIEDANYQGAIVDTLRIVTTARVRRGLTINGGVDGSVQLLSPENTTLNDSAWISGDLLVPGQPTVRLNGRPNYGGTIAADGASSPNNYIVTLNGNATLRHVVQRVDPSSLPTVAKPAAPTGKTNVTLNQPQQAVADWAAVRNLTLNSNAGVREVPPGTYGTLTANGSAGFVLGVAGATEPSHYNLQGLTLNGASTLHVVGPVVITLAQGVLFQGTVGNPDEWRWLALRIASGGVTLNGSATLHGSVVAPSGTVTLNSNTTLRGEVAADRLQLNVNGVLDQPPED